MKRSEIGVNLGFNVSRQETETLTGKLADCDGGGGCVDRIGLVDDC